MMQRRTEDELAIVYKLDGASTCSSSGLHSSSKTPGADTVTVLTPVNWDLTLHAKPCDDADEVWAASCTLTIAVSDVMHCATLLSSLTLPMTVAASNLLRCGAGCMMLLLR